MEGLAKSVPDEDDVSFGSGLTFIVLPCLLVRLYPLKYAVN